MFFRSFRSNSKLLNISTKMQFQLTTIVQQLYSGHRDKQKHMMKSLNQVHATICLIEEKDNHVQLERDPNNKIISPGHVPDIILMI